MSDWQKSPLSSKAVITRLIFLTGEVSALRNVSQRHRRHASSGCQPVWLMTLYHYVMSVKCTIQRGDVAFPEFSLLISSLLPVSLSFLRTRLSPEIFLKRPVVEGNRWRLDCTLKRKAVSWQGIVGERWHTGRVLNTVRSVLMEENAPCKQRQTLNCLFSSQ